MKTTLILTVCALFCTSLYAGGGQEAAARLQERFAGLETFSARFVQDVYDVNQQLMQSTSGSLYISNSEVSNIGGSERETSLTGTEDQNPKPRLRWHSAEPMEQLIIADGQRIWLYDPDLLQVVVQNYPKELVDSPAMLLVSKSTALHDSYLVEAKDNNSFFLTPRHQESLYTRVNIVFTGDRPVAMTLHDSLNQTTRIEFHEVTINHPLDAELFRFDVPDGVDLIRND